MAWWQKVIMIGVDVVESAIDAASRIKVTLGKPPREDLQAEIKARILRRIADEQDRKAAKGDG